MTVSGPSVSRQATQLPKKNARSGTPATSNSQGLHVAFRSPQLPSQEEPQILVRLPLPVIVIGHGPSPA
jgi:hypothetical protein